MVYLLCVILFFFYVPYDVLGCALFCHGYSFFPQFFALPNVREILSFELISSNSRRKDVLYKCACKLQYFLLLGICGVHRFGGMCIHAGVLACTGSGQLVDIRCLPQLFSTLIFETGSPEIHLSLSNPKTGIIHTFQLRHTSAILKLWRQTLSIEALLTEAAGGSYCQQGNEVFSSMWCLIRKQPNNDSVLKCVP